MMLKPNEIESIRKKIDEINKFLEDEIEANPERLSQNGLYENVITKFNELLALIKRLIIENRLEKTKKLEEPRKRNIKKHLPELLEIKDSRFTSRIPTDVQSDFEQLQLNVSDNDLLLVYADVFRDKQLYAGPNCQKILLAITSYFSAGGYLTDKEEKLISFLDEIKPSEENKEDVATALNSRMETAKKDFFLPFEFIPDEALPKTTTAQTINIEDFSAYVKTIIFAENVLGIDDLISESRISAVMVEKDEEILSAWEKVIEAYNSLTPINTDDEAATIKQKEDIYASFLSAVYDFRRIITQCFPHLEGEEINTLFRDLSHYFKKHYPELQLTSRKKDSIIKRLIGLSSVSISNSKKINYTPVLENIASNILQTLNDDDLPPSQANNSNVLMRTVNSNITHLYNALRSFLVVAFTEKSNFQEDEASKNPADYGPLTKFFFQNKTVKSQLEKRKLAIHSELACSKAREGNKQALKRCRNTQNALTELNILECKVRTNPISNNLEKQGTFMYQVSRAKYTLSLQEIDLLEEVTRLKFGNKVVPIKNEKKTYSSDTNSYRELIKLIEVEKERRTEANKSWLRRLLPFLKEPIAVLDHAQLYISYHEKFYRQNKEAVGRLAGKKDETAAIEDHSSKIIRTQFNKIADRFFTFSARSKALKSLNTQMKEKTNQARILRHEAGDKKNRNTQIHQHLNLDRVLFQYDPLSRNKNSFFSDLKGNSISAYDLYIHYLQIKNYHSELNAVKNKIINQCKEVKQVSIVVNYKEKELIDKQSNDPRQLLINIEESKKQIRETVLTADSSLEEFKDSLNTVGLIQTLAGKAEDLLTAELTLLPLEKFKLLLKQAVVRGFDSLIEGFILPNEFKPSAKDEALVKIAEMLKKSDSAYKTLKDTALNYLNALQLQILAKHEAVDILQKLQSSKLSSDQLVKKLRKRAKHEQESLVSKVVDTEVNLMTSHSATANSKMLELIDDLNSFADAIQKGSAKNNFDIDQCLTALVKSCNFRIKSLEINKCNETLKVKEVLEDARQKVQALTYYSNHTPLILAGPQH